MPLPGADAVGEHVVFQFVDFFSGEIREQRGLQETEERLGLPAAVGPARLCREETDEEIGEHHQRVIVHGLLLVDEGGNLISLEGASEGVVIIFRRPHEH